jgi:hypothetical protein
MKCPQCESKLKFQDRYGRFELQESFDELTREWIHEGRIYKCLNPDCNSKEFEYWFHTSGSELLKGNPTW